MVYCLEQDIDKQMTSVSCSQQISCLVKLLFKLDFKCMLCAYIHIYVHDHMYTARKVLF